MTTGPTFYGLSRLNRSCNCWRASSAALRSWYGAPMTLRLDQEQAQQLQRRLVWIIFLGK